MCSNLSYYRFSSLGHLYLSSLKVYLDNNSQRFDHPSQKGDSNISLKVSDNHLLSITTSFLQLDLIIAWTKTKSTEKCMTLLLWVTNQSTFSRVLSVSKYLIYTLISKLLVFFVLAPSYSNSLITRIPRKDKFSKDLQCWKILMENKVYQLSIP